MANIETYLPGLMSAPNGDEARVTSSDAIKSIREWSKSWLYRVIWKHYVFDIDNNWNDMPIDCRGGTFENIVISDTQARQTITSTDGNGYVWSREVMLDGSDATPWVGGPNHRRALKVLTVGDSIAAGARNQGKGFAGDVASFLDKHEDQTLYFRNRAVGGAALSMRRATRSGNSKAMIANQLVAESGGWEPDVIIAGTGTNDYAYNYELGTVPTRPLTDAEYKTLMRKTLDDASRGMTALEGLECLLYKMVMLYPRAKRVFVTQHRVLDKPWTKNSANIPYDQTEITEAIIKTCRIYGCMVADVFNGSSLNTYFSQYVSPTRVLPSGGTLKDTTNTEYCENDGDHPTALGYWEFYVPFVRQCVECTYALGDYIPIEK